MVPRRPLSTTSPQIVSTFNYALFYPISISISMVVLIAFLDDRLSFTSRGAEIVLRGGAKRGTAHNLARRPPFSNAPPPFREACAVPLCPFQAPTIPHKKSNILAMRLVCVQDMSATPMGQLGNSLPHFNFVLFLETFRFASRHLNSSSINYLFFHWLDLSPF